MDITHTKLGPRYREALAWSASIPVCGLFIVAEDAKTCAALVKRGLAVTEPTYEPGKTRTRVTPFGRQIAAQIAPDKAKPPAPGPGRYTADNPYGVPEPGDRQVATAVPEVELYRREAARYRSRPFVSRPGERENELWPLWDAAFRAAPEAAERARASLPTPPDLSDRSTWC